MNLLRPIPQIRTHHVLDSVRWAAETVVDLSAAALPHGGQRGSRRNAWAAMVHDAAVARTRDEALEAVERSAVRADHHRADHQRAQPLRQAR